MAQTASLEQELRELLENNAALERELEDIEWDISRKQTALSNMTQEHKLLLARIADQDYAQLARLKGKVSTLPPFTAKF